ncbi:kinase-like domain-containing protein, partial [Chaetomium sp. MPI-SDFR-AT-0129]
MADTDLIARVYPYAEKDREEVPEATLKAFKTSSGCFDPLAQLSERRSASRRERESTAPRDTQNGPVLDTLPYVELRLSDTPRFRSGFVFGCDPNSDVVLPNDSYVGHHHFSLTFDDKKRLIVKDWGSLNGTEVTYGKQGHGERSAFQWILGGHDIPFKAQPIVVIAPARPPVRLQIVVVPNDVASPAYIDKVDRFLQSTATATEDLLSSLDIANRRVTEQPTGARILETGPIHLRKRLGEGSFASVTHYWDVSTGEEYALKKPSKKAVRKRRVRVESWKNEAYIMNLIQHPHVVKLLKSDFTQGPRLYLDYVPRGSLADQPNISAAECVSILQQCLSALEYLHGSDPPIVHRDIKADNILVQYRKSDGIYVKFGDFGMAKDYDDMSTICGNFERLAPEVYQNHQYIEAGGEGRVSYTEAVDVWSLGVVVYELLCPLPQFRNQYISSGMAWARKLIKTFSKDFEERPDELKRFLLEAMVVLRPEQRWPAKDCLPRAMLLPVPAMDQTKTAVAVAHVGDDERSTIRYKAEPSMAQGLETPIRQPGSSEYSTLSTDAGRYDRSGAPTP